MGKTSPLKVLIVEDEALIAMDVEMMVEDAGHVVVGAAVCLDDVADMSAETCPDIALVDMQLAKGTTGLQVSDLIQKRWADTIIIFVTANPNAIPEGLAGAHGIIPKPFSRNGFMSAMSFLGEGLIDPPPATPKPNEMIASAALLEGFGA